MTIAEELAISFGPTIHAGMVRDAVQETVNNWIVTYLAQMARLDGQTGAGGATFPPFRSYPDSLDTERYAEDQLPALVIVVPGTADRPIKRGSGKITVHWSVVLGVSVTGPNKTRTLRLAQYYTAAVRMIMLQQRGLRGAGDTPFAAGVEWLAEHYAGNVIRSSDMRTMVVGMLQFLVQTDEVLDTSQGPLTPIPDGQTPTGWPTVATPSVNVAGYPVSEEIP